MFAGDSKTLKFTMTPWSIGCKMEVVFGSRYSTFKSTAVLIFPMFGGCLEHCPTTAVSSFDNYFHQSSNAPLDKNNLFTSS
jgi:hypothetical protein